MRQTTRPTHRWLIAMTVGVMLLAACGGGDQPGLIDLGGDGTPTADGSGSDGSSASGAPSDGTEPAPSSPDAGTTGAEESTAPPAATPVNDSGGVGANGRAMLRGDRARLVLEIDVQEGVSVDQAAVDHLVSVIGQHADKPGGVVFAGSNTFASERTEWSASDLREVAAANRSTSSNDSEVSVHVLYVRGGFYQGGEQTSAIGVAYTASQMALFPERWAGLGSLLGSDRAIERAVLVHELGHLFGLVNLTYTSDIAHEDPEHPKHSNNRDSVMFHAIESTLIGQVFSGPPPDQFDAADAADLDGLMSGKY